jgi:hypothetical protein
MGFWRPTLDCALTCFRDPHADDLDRAVADIHPLVMDRGKSVVDEVCQQLGWVGGERPLPPSEATDEANAIEKGAQEFKEDPAKLIAVRR